MVKKSLFNITIVASSLFFLTSCASTSKQLIGTTWVGDYERYKAEKKHAPDMLEHGIICISFSKDSLKQCDTLMGKFPRPCRYFYLKYKQDSIFFIDKKQTLVLKKRTDDCLELEHTERGILYYLKPYKEEKTN